MAKAKVILFKESGKYYTEEEWEIPTEDEVLARFGNRGDSVIPYCMVYSLDAHTIGGPVLVETQEPWGYPHLLHAKDLPKRSPRLSDSPVPVGGAAALGDLRAEMRQEDHIQDIALVIPDLEELQRRFKDDQRLVVLTGHVRSLGLALSYTLERLQHP